MRKCFASLFTGTILLVLGGLANEGISPRMQHSQAMAIFKAQFSTNQLTSKADSTVPPTLQPIASSTAISTATWKTYTDSGYGFSIKYPSIMGLISGKELHDKYYGNGLGCTASQHEEGLVCFTLSEGTYPETTNTDFAGAFVEVSIVTGDLQYCLAFRDWKLPEFQEVKRVVFNGIPFSSTKRYGVAAGTHGAFASYRTFVHNICYVLSTTLVTVMRYENTVWTSTPTVRPFTEADDRTIQAIFDQMFSTFSFTSLEPSDLIIPEGAADWHTYTNSTYGFSIDYPPTMEVKSHKEVVDNQGFADIPLCNYDRLHAETQPIICFYLPKGMYPKTTNNEFRGASLAVSVYNLNEQDCLSFRDVNYQQEKIWPSLFNGITFSQVDLTTGRHYRAFVHSTCFDITIIGLYSENLGYIFNQMLSTLSFASSEQQLTSTAPPTGLPTLQPTGLSTPVSGAG